MAARKKATPVPVEDAGTPAELMEGMEAEAGAGLENATAEDYSIPFIALLQKMSPQCDEDSEAYVEGARPGMFWDSGAMEILTDAEGVPLESIRVTPVYYERRYNQWRDRDEGGGFVASHATSAAIVGQATRDDRGRLQLPDGSYLADTRQFFCMLYNPDMSSARPIMMGLASTQIRVGRQWLTRIKDFRVDGAKGKFNPPMYGQVWELGTVTQSNAKGSWRGWKIGAPSLIQSQDIFRAAKDLKESIMSGAVQVSAPSQATGSADDSPPFDAGDDGAAF